MWAYGMWVYAMWVYAIRPYNAQIMTNVGAHLCVRPIPSMRENIEHRI
ncbi:MAG: hypothetical protein LBS01_04695 [Prevotellaceae bacterium]|nr:hypothetical protein [Prevotellaceae bacterium]